MLQMALSRLSATLVMSRGVADRARLAAFFHAFASTFSSAALLRHSIGFIGSYVVDEALEEPYDVA
jgi:hypothetical protein